jgi:hypothetical protein
LLVHGRFVFLDSLCRTPGLFKILGLIIACDEGQASVNLLHIINLVFRFLFTRKQKPRGSSPQQHAQTENNT